MFELGLAEIIICAIVVIVFFKPHEIPQLLRDIGKFINKIKNSANEIRDEIESLGDVKDEIKDLEGKTQPTYDLDSFIESNKPSKKDDDK